MLALDHPFQLGSHCVGDNVAAALPQVESPDELVGIGPKFGLYVLAVLKRLKITRLNVF